MFFQVIPLTLPLFHLFCNYIFILQGDFIFLEVSQVAPAQLVHIREAFKRAEEDYFAPDDLWMLKEDKGKEHHHPIRNRTE